MLSGSRRFGLSFSFLMCQTVSPSVCLCPEVSLSFLSFPLCVLSLIHCWILSLLLSLFFSILSFYLYVSLSIALFKILPPRPQFIASCWISSSGTPSVFRTYTPTTPRRFYRTTRPPLTPLFRVTYCPVVQCCRTTWDDKEWLKLTSFSIDRKCRTCTWSESYMYWGETPPWGNYTLLSYTTPAAAAAAAATRRQGRRDRKSNPCRDRRKNGEYARGKWA